MEREKESGQSGRRERSGSPARPGRAAVQWRRGPVEGEGRGRRSPAARPRAAASPSGPGPVRGEREGRALTEGVPTCSRRLLADMAPRRGCGRGGAGRRRRLLSGRGRGAAAWRTRTGPRRLPGWGDALATPLASPSGPASMARAPPPPQRPHALPRASRGTARAPRAPRHNGVGGEARCMPGRRRTGGISAPSRPGEGAQAGGVVVLLKGQAPPVPSGAFPAKNGKLRGLAAASHPQVCPVAPR